MSNMIHLLTQLEGPVNYEGPPGEDRSDYDWAEDNH